MYKRRSVNIMLAGMIVLCSVIVIALVYAGFTGQLNISSQNVVGRKSNWDIHFEHLSNVTTNGTAKVLGQPTLDSNDPTSVEDYSVSFTSPGDYITFTVDVVNNGNYNASITSVSVPTPQCSSVDTTSAVNMCNHIHYYLTYDNGAAVQVGDTLYAKETNTIKVKLEYDDTVTASELASEDVSISNLDISVNFEQSGGALVKDNGEVADYKVYKVGNKITLNNEDYWVIENSGADKEYVVALKDTPLTVAEVNLYGGVGTENNFVNKYTQGSVGTASNQNGYGGVAFYSRDNCGYVSGSYTGNDNFNNNYDDSDIKHIVDNWANDKFENGELKEISNYEARLIYTSEMISNIGPLKGNSYWSMTKGPYNEIVQCLNTTCHFSWYQKVADLYQIRPVINVYKSALETNNNVNNNE